MYTPLIRPIKVIGTGRADPSYVVPASYLESLPLNTTTAWILKRVGVEERRWAGPQENMYILGAIAAEKSLLNAGKSIDDVNHLYVAHNDSGEFNVPNAAAIIARLLGYEGRPAKDIKMGCSGGVNAFEAAVDNLARGELESLVEKGADYRREPGRVALVVVTDTMTSYPRWDDRHFTVMASDGGAAVVLQPTEGDGAEVLHIDTRSYGGMGHAIIMPTGLKSPFDYTKGELPVPQVEDLIERPFFIMDGNAVYEFMIKEFTDRLPEVVAQAEGKLERMGRAPLGDFQLVTHQANKRGLMAGAGDYWNIPKRERDERLPSRIYLEGCRTRGNNSGVSLYMAHDMTREEQWLRPEGYVFDVAFGAGLSDGFVLLKNGSMPYVSPTVSDESLREKYYARWQKFEADVDGVVDRHWDTYWENLPLERRDAVTRLWESVLTLSEKEGLTPLGEKAEKILKKIKSST